MPDPEKYQFYGQDYIWGSPEFNDYLKKYYGEDFYKELEDWKTGKAKIPPRSGWDYLLQTEAKPADARETQRLIDRYKVDIDAGKYKNPTPVPTPDTSRDPLLDEAKDIAGGGFHPIEWLLGLFD